MIWISDEWKDYEVLDTSDGERLERWGKYILVRPDPQVIWSTPKRNPGWKKYDARYSRSNSGGGHWSDHHLPERWQVHYRELTFNVKPMNFKHTGVFPEQAANWDFIRDKVASAGRPVRVLNLFAYSGGSTLAAALGGADVCHLDASKGMVEWARENARLNGLADRPIRWIVDDAHKFMRREIRRGRRYDGIVLDPPSFGRGAGGEMYKIERDLKETLALVKELLSERPAFVLFSSHTPGLSCQVAENILAQLFPSARCEAGEMLLEGRALPCPSGVYCRVTFGTAQAGGTSGGK